MSSRRQTSTQCGGVYSLTLRRVLALTFVAVALSCGALASYADDAKPTRIHVKLDVYYERDREIPWSGAITHDITLILTGKNHFEETYVQVRHAGNGAAHDIVDTVQQGQALGGNLWHVAGPHELVRIYKAAQNIDTITIRVDGANCTASWESRLLPGFQEYTFYTVYWGGVLHYKVARMIDSTCVIDNTG